MADLRNFLNELMYVLKIGISSGNGTPTQAAPKGSLYIQLDATTTTSRLWINTDGSTTWAYFTTSA